MIKKIENTIIETLNSYKINSFNDRKNVGIWVKQNNKKKKVAAIGIKIKKWIAYHGFSINIDNDIKPYDKIVPCGIDKDKITNLINYKKQNYKNFKNVIIKNFIRNFEN